MRVSGSYAYVGDLKWVRVIDISDPTAPREIASYKTPGTAEEITVVDGAAYIANYDAGLMILGIEGQWADCASGASCDERVVLPLRTVAGP